MQNFNKNKFISSIIGSLAVFSGIAFILPLNNFSVYITSYIHIHHSYVTMHYGLFISLIFSFANTFSNSIGGYLENLFGFFKTIIIGFIILLSRTSTTTSPTASTRKEEKSSLLARASASTRQEKRSL